MSTSNQALKERAKKALLDGKYAKALEYFDALHQGDPKDLRVHAKVAELREKTGDKDGAVKDYLKVAHAYAEQGFVVQAIAINKIILRIDPSQTQVKQRLKALSVERGDDWAISQAAAAGDEAAAKGKGFSREHFARTPLLSDLSGEELEAFIDSLELRSFAAGSYIYREGDYGNHLYLIAMGGVRLKVTDEKGREKVFSNLVEGDFFGEHAFMAKAVHSEAAMAESEVNLLMIDRDTFDRWVEKYPSIRSVVEEFYRQRVLAKVLAITPVFEGVPPAARLALADRFRLKSFVDGSVIVREGDAGQTFYLIRSGRVQVATRSMHGEAGSVPLGSMGQGEFFGEVSLLTDKPRTATVVASGEVELMELSRDDFNAIADAYPSVREVVEAYQKQRVQDTIKTLMGGKTS